MSQAKDERAVKKHEESAENASRDQRPADGPNPVPLSSNPSSPAHEWPTLFPRGEKRNVLAQAGLEAATGCRALHVGKRLCRGVQARPVRVALANL